MTHINISRALRSSESREEEPCSGWREACSEVAVVLGSRQDTQTVVWKVRGFRGLPEEATLVLSHYRS